MFKNFLRMINFDFFIFQVVDSVYSDKIHKNYIMAGTPLEDQGKQTGQALYNYTIQT